MERSVSCELDSAFHFLSNDVFDERGLSSTGPDVTGQIPTPPASKEGSPIDGSDTIVSVSTIFYPDAAHSTLPPDLILLSSDSVFFYVHSGHLLESSLNAFNSLLPLLRPQNHPNAIIVLPESSQVLNLVLHTIYNISCIQFSPSLDCITQAVKSLTTYGIPLKSYAAPNTPLYGLILSRAPLYPIELYAIASENDLSDLAVAISSHLLAFNLSGLTDELAVRIGPVYLKKLFFLHLGRNDALKRLLHSPPSLHGPTSSCDFSQQKKLTRAWALSAAYLVWDARPDLSTGSIESALGSLQEHLTCSLCQQTLKCRVKRLIIEWSNVKVEPFNSRNLAVLSTQDFLPASGITARDQLDHFLRNPGIL